MVNALKRELELRAEYLPDNIIDTIYFGGGTPSVLDEGELKQIFSTIASLYEVSTNVEVTLEVNPDDVSPQSLAMWRNFGVNRLSMGIQSFDENHLKYLNRSHNGMQAKEALALLKPAGFDNYTIDLIYAIPACSHDILRNDLETVMLYNAPHLSCYNLTIEPNTVFGRWVSKGRINDVDEEFALGQYHLLTAFLEREGYRQYEISNFSKVGFESRHNSNYWKQTPYLGIGPGAHSFDGKSRQANISNNALYIKSILANKIPATVELLDDKMKLNELIMTGIRLAEGVDLGMLASGYQYDLLHAQADKISDLLSNGLIYVESNHLIATKKGKLMADWIAGELFLV